MENKNQVIKKKKTNKIVKNKKDNKIKKQKRPQIIFEEEDEPKKTSEIDIYNTPEFKEFIAFVAKKKGYPMIALYNNAKIRQYYKSNYHNVNSGIVSNEDYRTTKFTKPTELFNKNKVNTKELTLLNPNNTKINGEILPKKEVKLEKELSQADQVREIIRNEEQGKQNGKFNFETKESIAIKKLNDEVRKLKSRYRTTDMVKKLDKSRNIIDVDNYKKSYKQLLYENNMGIKEKFVPALVQVVGATNANNLLAVKNDIELLYPSEKTEEVYNKMREIFEDQRGNLVIYNPIFNSFLTYLLYNPLTDNKLIKVYEPDSSIVKFFQSQFTISNRITFIGNGDYMNDDNFIYFSNMFVNHEFYEKGDSIVDIINLIYHFLFIKSNN